MGYCLSQVQKVELAQMLSAYVKRITELRKETGNLESLNVQTIMFGYLLSPEIGC